MLVKCPSCGARLRVSTGQFNMTENQTRYLCQECEQIVLIDLEKDVIPSSSSSDRTDKHLRAQRVLVVDDTVSFARAAEDLLKKEGYIVMVAHDGVEALKKITEEHPDIVLLDLFMPKMTGFEVLRALRTNSGYKSFRNLPVLITSGSYNPAEIEILHDLGASGFINKEAIPEFLAYRIKKLLSSRPAPETQVET